MRYFLLNRIRILFLAGSIGLIIFYLFFNRLAVTDNRSVTVNRENARILAEKYLNAFGHSVKNYHVEYTYFPDDATRWYFSKIHGIRPAQKMLQEHPVLGDGFRFRFHENLPRDVPQESFEATIAPNGELIRWMHNLPANAARTELPDSAALRLVREFAGEQKLLDPAGFQTEISSVRLKNRVDHTVRFLRTDSLLRGEIQIQFIVRGDQVAGYARSFIIPPEFSAKFQSQTNFKNQFADFELPLLILIFIWLIVEFSRLYRNGEIGQRNGLYLLFFSFCILLFQSLNELTGEAFGWTLYVKTRSQVQITWAIQKIFNEDVILSLIVFFAFLVGESLLRVQNKSKKLTSTDSIFESEWLNTSVAQSMTQGFLAGGVLLGGMTLLGLIFTQIFQAFFSQNLLTRNFDMLFPWLTPILVSAQFTMKTVVVSLIFLITISRNYLKFKIIGIIPFLLVLLTTGVLEFSFFPHYFNLIFELLVGLALVLLYFKFDVLTTVIAYWVTGILLLAYPLLDSNNGFLVLSGFSATIVGFTPLFNAFLGFKTRRPFQQKAEAVPAHVKQITERERLSRELEIARNIQLQLLPQHVPQNQAFDISGLCLPAREVGGDYFDFIPFNPHQIGLGIGDVSGKGIPAAIYMTLTKGIFLSACNENTSPAAVLNQVNKLLYRIIDRGHFVSMFFGVLDTRQLTLTFARAGHNPGIWFRAQPRQIEWLELGGLALGLDSGAIFETVLNEQTVQLAPGDVLIFYTDGFSEARNAAWEEFGEHRLVDSLKRNHELPARNIIQNILFELNTFIKGQPQQDDMTMVAVKVNRNGII